MSESTQRLIRDLANDLPPVRPVPRIRVSLAWVLTLAVSAVVLGALGLGLNEQLPGELSRSPVLVAMALSLFARAAPSRGSSLVAVGALGAASLGGIATLAHCPQMDPLHLLLGHALAPLSGLAFLFLPALLLWRGLAPGFVTER